MGTCMQACRHSGTVLYMQNESVGWLLNEEIECMPREQDEWIDRCLGGCFTMTIVPMRACNCNHSHRHNHSHVQNQSFRHNHKDIPKSPALTSSHRHTITHTSPLWYLHFRFPHHHRFSFTFVLCWAGAYCVFAWIFHAFSADHFFAYWFLYTDKPDSMSWYVHACVCVRMYVVVCTKTRTRVLQAMSVLAVSSTAV